MFALSLDESVAKKVKRAVLPFIISFMVIVFLIFMLQYGFIAFFLYTHDITLSVTDNVTDQIELIRSMIPNFYLPMVINSLGLITGGYLGIEQIYRFSASMNMERGVMSVDPDKDEVFRKILVYYIVLLVITIIALIFYGKYFEVGYKEVMFWTTVLIGEYVYGRKAVKAAANIDGKKPNPATKIQDVQ